MLDAFAVIGFALLLGQRAVVCGPVLLVGLIAYAIVWRRLSTPCRMFVPVALLAGALRADSLVSQEDALRERARDALGPPARCDGRATVVTSPVRRAGTYRVSADLRDLACEGRPIAGTHRVRLYLDTADAHRGDVLFVIATLGPAQLFHNPDTADPRPAAARSGVVMSGGVVFSEAVSRSWSVGALIDRVRGFVRARIDATYSPDAAPLARALVLGEEDLTEEDGDAFRRSGLAHLLAVSGTHLTLVVLGAVAVLRALLVRVLWISRSMDAGRLAAALGVVVAFVYADFAGGSGSARRAAWMVAAMLLARALGRRENAVRSLGVTLVAVGLLDPLGAFDLSLLLSTAATVGLFVLSPPIAAFLTRRIRFGFLVHPLSATLAASLACAPVLATLSPSLPLAGVAANVLAVPIGELVALPVCLLHALLAPFSHAEKGAAALGSGALIAVRAIARVSSAPSWAAVPVPPPTVLQGAIALVALALLVASRRKAPIVALGIAALLLAEGLARREGSPRGVLRVTFLDVAQGDSALIDFPDGAAMLVDGGGLVGSPVDTGRAVVLPTLRARRRDRVDVAVLSHPHPDHFLGLASALPTLDVGEMWDTGQGESEGAGPIYRDLLSGLRSRGVPILRPPSLCGLPRSFGAASVEVLAPCPEVDPLTPPNDNSFVIRVSLGSHSALLVGDAEHLAEAGLLLARPRDLRASVLKVGHHGSRTSSTPAFVSAVAPAFAVASSGARNRFGHPHPKTLDTFARLRVPLLRTDRGGAVIWETDGRSFTWWQRR